MVINLSHVFETRISPVALWSPGRPFPRTCARVRAVRAQAKAARVSIAGAKAVAKAKAKAKAIATHGPGPNPVHESPVDALQALPARRRRRRV